jgi:hypothetical protein
VGDLTKEEQGALDKLQKVCDSHHAKTTDTLQKCALLKQQQQLMTKLRTEEDARKKADDLQEAAARLQGQRQKALAYVSQQMNAIQTVGLQINGALWKATTDYDVILGAQAGQPVIIDIILNLGIEMIPELKLLGRSMKAFELARSKAIGRKGWEAMADLASFLGNAAPRKVPIVGRFTPAVKSFGDFLDRRSNDIIAAIRNPVVANSSIDGATAARMAAYDAKNRILSDALGDLHRKLVIASFMEDILHKFIFWWEGEDVLAIVQQAFQAAGLDSVPYEGNLSSFEVLSDIMLHDMLHAYVKTYFLVYGEIGKTIDDLPDREDWIYIHGLDVAQRQMIYDRVKAMKIPNHSGRMPVFRYKDLLRWWDGRFEPTMKPFTLSLGGG